MDVGSADSLRAVVAPGVERRAKKANAMDALIIEGGKPLSGRVQISGAKNAALPVMAASLLTPGTHRLRNVPRLADTRTMAKVLEHLGARVEFTGSDCSIDTSNVASVEAPYDLVRTMRASIYVLGPLLGRFGSARVSLPGGCAWGPRPVNLHIEGMDALGAQLQIDHGYIVAKDAKLRGATIHFRTVSVITLVPSATESSAIIWGCMSVGKPGNGEVVTSIAPGRTGPRMVTQPGSGTTSAPHLASAWIAAAQCAGSQPSSVRLPPEIAAAARKVAASMRSGMMVVSIGSRLRTP